MSDDVNKPATDEEIAAWLVQDSHDEAEMGGRGTPEELILRERTRRLALRIDELQREVEDQSEAGWRQRERAEKAEEERDE